METESPVERKAIKVFNFLIFSLEFKLKETDTCAQYELYPERVSALTEHGG